MVTAAEKSRFEPVARTVEAGPKLRDHLKKTGKTQEWLACKAGIKQQKLSAYVNQLARPKPMSPEAFAIQEATAGEITVWDWMTPEERESYKKLNIPALLKRA